MKKILTGILAIQIALALAGCCCNCAKKAEEQKPESAQEQPAEEEPAQ